MKRSISIFFCSIALVAMVATSCTKFLTEKPLTFVSPQSYYNTEAEMKSVVSGCYSGLSSVFSGLVGFSMSAHVMFEGLTGNYDRLGAGGSGLKVMGFELPYDTSSEGINENLWKGYYFSVENCNSTIYQLEAKLKDGSSQVSDEQIKYFLAEVYTLRAYYYYRLVTIFGPVPYKTERTSGVNNAQIPLDTEETIFNGIVSDLQTAESYMDGQPMTRTDGHISLGAIKSILAKVYLTMAGYPLKKTENYALAYKKANEVIASGAYSLFDDYSKLRNQAYENTGEVIFAIQREPEHASSNLTCFTAPIEPSICANSSNGGAFVPTAAFYASYEDNDARKTAFFFSEYNGQVFERPHVFKYFNEDSKCISDGKDGLDLIVIRYADILLVLAESACAGGTTTDAAALDAYHLVHSRAFAGAIKPASLSQDDVLKERIFELSSENQTWFDMTRTHKAWNANQKKMVEMMGYSPDGHATINGHAFTEDDVYISYPAREVRYNPNLVR